MYGEHIQRFRRVREMKEWWPYGGADMATLALATLLRNAPPRPEALEACGASKVVRSLRDMPPKHAAKQKFMFWFQMAFIMPVMGPLMSAILCTGALFIKKSINPTKALRMMLYRPDMYMYIALEDWESGKTPIHTMSQAVKHFSEVDMKRMYSLFIRSMHHLVDVYNCPAHGEVQDKLTFYAMCKEHGLPCAAPLTPTEIRELTDEDMPLFMKPSNEQEAVGAKVVNEKDDPDLLKTLESPENWVVQPKLRNCDFLREHFPPNPPLCGVRITTMMTKEGPKVLEAWIRVGAEGAAADCPFSAGGCEFAIFAETGVVWQGSSEKQMKFVDSSLEPSLRVANGASKEISGVQIPHWEESVAMCMKAHSTFAPQAFTIGWDVAHTPQGPMMVEANLISNVGCFMGLRYGSMCMLWPNLPLMWLHLADWMEGKQDWPECSHKAKLKAIKHTLKESKGLLKKAKAQRAKLEKKIEKAKAKSNTTNDVEGAQPNPKLQRYEYELLLRKGEIFGLKVESEALHARLIEGSQAKRKYSQAKKAGEVSLSESGDLGGGKASKEPSGPGSPVPA